MPASCECMLVITVIISTRNGDGSEKLVSKHSYPSIQEARTVLSITKDTVQTAIKNCFGRGCQADDIIEIDDIIVNAKDIIAAGFRIIPSRITIDNPEPKVDSSLEDSETK